MQELEHWKQKFDIAGGATEGYFSKRWIAENLLGMSEDEFLRNQREMFFDKKYSAKLEAATAGGESAESASGEGGLAGGMGDLGGTADIGGDAGAPPAGDLGGGETPAGETGGAEGGDTDLLAEPPPAKRDDFRDVRPPFIVRKGGASKKMRSEALPIETTSKRSRNPKGYMGDDGIKNASLEEAINMDEQRLFSVSKEIETLLEGLYKKEKKHETQ